MQRMRKAIEGCGLPFRGFRTLPDGSVEALVGEPAALTPTAEPALPSERLDDELAEWAEKNGYN